MAGGKYARGMFMEETATETLVSVATDWREDKDRLDAAMTLLARDPAIGRDVLLAMIVDLDAEPDDRLAALRRLLEMDPASGAAARWLMGETRLRGLRAQHKADANELITRSHGAESWEAGLRLVAGDRHLDDTSRVLAGCELVERLGNEAYEALKRQWDVRTLVLTVSAHLDQHHLQAHTVMDRLAVDDTVPPRLRSLAADTIEGPP